MTSKVLSIRAEQLRILLNIFTFLQENCPTSSANLSIVKLSYLGAIRSKASCRTRIEWLVFC